MPQYFRPNRSGRPSAIDRVVARNPDGTDITVSERIIALLRAGNYLETAAQASDCAKDSAYEWLRHGTRVRRQQIAAEDRGETPDKPTEYDLKCMAFSDAVTTARDASIAEDVIETARMARRRQNVVTTVTESTWYDDNGRAHPTTSTVTKTETLQPDSRVLLWRLERRAPQQWGRKDRIEITGDEGGPVQITITDRLANEMIELAGRIAVEELTELPPVEADAP